MKSLLKSTFQGARLTTSAAPVSNVNKMTKLALAVMAIVSFVGCSTSTNDLTGVPGRSLWFHPQPFGTVYIPSGTFHSGQSDQDVFQSFIAPNKQVSIVAMWMDETEITNNEYRQFVEFVVDSIMREMSGDDALFTEDDDGHRYINYDVPLEREKYPDELEGLYYGEEERFRGKKEIDVNQLFYTYQWFDYQFAANDPENQDRYKDGRVKNRRKYIKNEKTLIYPDTLCWVRDFTYSYNDPMARHYFHHVKYDDYPVVGVNWHQAKAFAAWRTIYKNNYWVAQEQPITEDFRLPTEFEWEYAARGGRNASQYPWGGPYTRNSKGCMLANFKPLRGNYGADGGMYPVRVDSYFPNDYGLYNMAGNVAEWTINAWSEQAQFFEHDLNPDYRMEIPETGEVAATFALSLKRKVIRGGSWKDVAYFIQNGSRTFEYQDTCKSYVGFRCVQTYIGRSNKDRK